MIFRSREHRRLSLTEHPTTKNAPEMSVFHLIPVSNRLIQLLKYPFIHDLPLATSRPRRTCKAITKRQRSKEEEEEEDDHLTHETSALLCGPDERLALKRVKMSWLADQEEWNHVETLTLTL